MKSLVTWIVIVGLIGSAIPLAATSQNPPQYANVQRLLRASGRHVQEIEGSLAVDRERHEIRLEVEGAPIVIPFGAVAALHYEKSVDASKWGWPLRNSNHFLVVYYEDGAGRQVYETLKLSKPDVDRMLQAIEAGTGLTIDRSDAKRSFLGVPIRAAIGDLVVVTDMAGSEHEGTITRLSSSSLEPTFTPATFDKAAIKSVHRPRHRGHEMAVGFGVGAAAGAVEGAFVGAGLGGNSVAAVQGAAMAGTMMGGIGIAIAAVASSYRHRATRDIYLGS